MNLLPNGDKEMINNQDKFVEELKKTTKVSTKYAIAAFYTLKDWEKENPKRAAEIYKIKFYL